MSSTSGQQKGHNTASKMCKSPGAGNSNAADPLASYEALSTNCTLVGSNNLALSAAASMGYMALKKPLSPRAATALDTFVHMGKYGATPLAFDTHHSPYGVQMTSPCPAGMASSSGPQMVQVVHTPSSPPFQINRQSQQANAVAVKGKVPVQMTSPSPITNSQIPVITSSGAQMVQIIHAPPSPPFQISRQQQTQPPNAGTVKVKMTSPSPVSSPQNLRPPTPQPSPQPILQQIPVMTSSGAQMVQIIHAPPSPPFQINRQQQPPVPVKVKPPLNILPKPPGGAGVPHHHGVKQAQSTVLRGVPHHPQQPQQHHMQQQQSQQPQQHQPTANATNQTTTQIVLPNQTLLPAAQPPTLLFNQMPFIVQQNTGQGVQLILRPGTPTSASHLAASKLGSPNIILQHPRAPTPQPMRVLTANGMLQQLAAPAAYFTMNQAQQQAQQQLQAPVSMAPPQSQGQLQPTPIQCLPAIVAQQSVLSTPEQLPPPKKKPKKKKKNKEPTKLDLANIMKLSGIGDDDDVLFESDTSESAQNVESNLPETDEHSFPKRIGNIHISAVTDQQETKALTTIDTTTVSMATKTITSTSQPVPITSEKLVVSAFGTQSQLSVQQSLSDINAINQNLTQIGLINQGVAPTHTFLNGGPQILDAAHPAGLANILHNFPVLNGQHTLHKFPTNMIGSGLISASSADAVLKSGQLFGTKAPSHFNIPMQNFSNSGNLILNQSTNAIIASNFPNLTLSNGLISGGSLTLAPNFLSAASLLQSDTTYSGASSVANTGSAANSSPANPPRTTGGFKLALSEDGRLILQHDPTLNQDIQSQLLLQSIFGINLQGGNLVLTSIPQSTSSKPTPPTITVSEIKQQQSVQQLTATKTTNIVQSVISSTKTDVTPEPSLNAHPPNYSYIVNLTPDQLETLKRNGQLTVNGQTIFMHRPPLGNSGQPDCHLADSNKTKTTTVTKTIAATMTAKKKSPVYYDNKIANVKTQTSMAKAIQTTQPFDLPAPPPLPVPVVDNNKVQPMFVCMQQQQQQTHVNVSQKIVGSELVVEQPVNVLAAPPPLVSMHTTKANGETFVGSVCAGNEQLNQEQQLPTLIIGNNNLLSFGNEIQLNNNDTNANRLPSGNHSNNNNNSNVVYQRIQTIQLTPQKQQLLKSVQLQIQALTTRLQQKSTLPDEVTKQRSTDTETENEIHAALRHLFLEQQKILATGKVLPTLNQPLPSNTVAMTTAVSVSAPVITTATNSFKQPTNVNHNNNNNNNAFLTSLLQQPTVSHQQNQKVFYHHGNQIIAISPQTWQSTTSNNNNCVQTVTTTTCAPASSNVGKMKKIQLLPNKSQAVTTTLPITTVTMATPMVTTNTTAAMIATASPQHVDVGLQVTPSPPPPPLPPPQPQQQPSKTMDVKMQSNAPAPTKTMYSKAHLIEQQLATDQNGAINPDITSPFANKADACKRLVRYHCYNQPVLSQKDLNKADEIFELTARHFIEKFRTMVNKYKYLLFREGMRQVQTSEMMMIDRMFLAEEQQSFLKLQSDIKLRNELEMQEDTDFKVKQPDDSHTGSAVKTEHCDGDNHLLHVDEFYDENDVGNSDLNIKCGLNYFTDEYDEEEEESGHAHNVANATCRFNEECSKEELSGTKHTNKERYNTTKIIGNFEIEINNKGCGNVQESCYTKNFRQKIIDQSNPKLDNCVQQKMNEDYDEWLCIQRELGYFPAELKSEPDSKEGEVEYSSAGGGISGDGLANAVSQKRASNDPSRLETLKRFRVEKVKKTSGNTGGGVIGEVKFEVRIEHKKRNAQCFAPDCPDAPAHKRHCAVTPVAFHPVIKREEFAASDDDANGSGNDNAETTNIDEQVQSAIDSILNLQQIASMAHSVSGATALAASTDVDVKPVLKTNTSALDALDDGVKNILS